MRNKIFTLALTCLCFTIGCSDGNEEQRWALSSVDDNAAAPELVTVSSLEMAGFERALPTEPLLHEHQIFFDDSLYGSFERQVLIYLESDQPEIDYPFDSDSEGVDIIEYQIDVTGPFTLLHGHPSIGTVKLLGPDGNLLAAVKVGERATVDLSPARYTLELESALADEEVLLSPIIALSEESMKVNGSLALENVQTSNSHSSDYGSETTNGSQYQLRSPDATPLPNSSRSSLEVGQLSRDNEELITAASSEGFPFGVYVEGLDAPTIVEVDTMIPAFIVRTPKAMNDASYYLKAYKIKTFEEFKDVYLVDDATSNGGTFGLTDHIYQYFASGGGAAYIVGLPPDTPSTAAAFQDALSRLADIDDLTAILMPEIEAMPSHEAAAAYEALCAISEKLNVMAILDLPLHDALLSLDHLPFEQRERCARYYPSMIITNRNGDLIQVSPGSTLAGIWWLRDRQKGVWNSASGYHLQNVVEVTQTVSDGMRDQYQKDGINVIQKRDSDKFEVYGGVTSAYDPITRSLIPPVRTRQVIQKTIETNLEAFAYVSNDPELWRLIKSMVQNYLLGLWKLGALTGGSPEDAFYVLVGLNETMTAEDILNGQIIVEVGVAQWRPRDFYDLRVSFQLAPY